MSNDKQGWRTVPVEPTPEMCRAANGLSTNRNRYAAMLNAAPTPPKSEPIQWAPGMNEFKIWCGNYFGPDSDDDYLAEAVFNLPPMAQKFKDSEPCDRNAVIEQCAHEGWMAASGDCEDRVCAAIRALKSQPAAVNFGETPFVYPAPVGFVPVKSQPAAPDKRDGRNDFIRQQGEVIRLQAEALRVARVIVERYLNEENDGMNGAYRLCCSTSPNETHKDCEASEALAAIDAAQKGEPVSQWQPIATAPKDGTAILALIEGSDIPQSVMYKNGGWKICWDEYARNTAYHPTHWVPLPVAPSAQKGGE